MKQCTKVPFGWICSIWVCAKWVAKLWMLSEKSKNFGLKKSDPNQSEPNQSNWNFLKSPRAPWSFFLLDMSSATHVLFEYEACHSKNRCFAISREWNRIVPNFFNANKRTCQQQFQCQQHESLVKLNIVVSQWTWSAQQRWQSCFSQSHPGSPCCSGHHLVFPCIFHAWFLSHPLGHFYPQSSLHPGRHTSANELSCLQLPDLERLCGLLFLCVWKIRLLYLAWRLFLSFGSIIWVEFAQSWNCLPTTKT